MLKNRIFDHRFRAGIPNSVMYWLGWICYFSGMIAIAAELVTLPYYPYWLDFHLQDTLWTVLGPVLEQIGFYPLRIFDILVPIGGLLMILDLYLNWARGGGSNVRLKLLLSILEIVIAVSVPLFMVLSTFGVVSLDIGSVTLLFHLLLFHVPIFISLGLVQLIHFRKCLNKPVLEK